MAHPLDSHREAIDTAIDAGATKVDIARALGVPVYTLRYYLDTRDVVRKDDSDIQAALARLAASVEA